MIHASKILIICGSTRQRRIGPQIAAWVAEVGRTATSAAFEVIDLRDWPLPMDDEPGLPAAGGGYAFEHTRAWSRKVSEGDALVFVTPQYNWGYPAPLKNALDHLHAEWAGKPAIIITYGGHGGDRCAGQLRQVLEGLHMKPTPTMPGLRLGRDRIEADTGAIDAAAVFAPQIASLHQAFGELMDTLGKA
jgi:NAD(P)H-dependent FMN reductase